MANTQKTQLKSWIIDGPIFFAVTAFLFTVIVTVLAGLLLPATPSSITAVGISTTITTIIAAVLSIRRIGIVPVDRNGFTAIFNTQMIITAIASITSLATAINMPTIQLWVFGLMQTQIGVIIGIITVILIVLLSLYVLGTIITCLWAKFLRARTMNIPTWKIICSMPFGFAMTWIPGYFMPTKPEKDTSISIDTKWISRLTKWTTKTITNAGFMFAVLTIANGFFTGLTSTLLMFSLAMIFAIWILQVGPKKFLKNIGGTYANTAIIINIATIIYLLVVAFII